ncbi:hypothetical protein [Fibrobacter succinogenes]|uniref:hypothetical protein n=1 Tax=Fibrobacter succinogenes TaxID=833 RepID=UPI001568F8CC|nr:hypothetical protein [Fibrobacter succinogenes]
MKPICLFLLFLVLTSCKYFLADAYHFKHVEIFSQVVKLNELEQVKSNFYFGNMLENKDSCSVWPEMDGRIRTVARIYDACHDTCLIEWIVDSNVVDKIKILEFFDNPDQ